MIRHAGLRLPAPPPVVPLTVAVIELPFRALLVSPVGAPPLFEPGLRAAFGAAVAVPAIAVRADEKDCAAVPARTDPLKENRFVVNRRHASSQAGLDNGGYFVAGWNQLCLVLPHEGCPNRRTPAALTTGVLISSSHL